MKFMISWKIHPGMHKSAAEAFMKSGGAPAPAGATLLGRWHAPGSNYGWALFEATDGAPLAEHLATWGQVLFAEITPVVEDEVAGQSFAKVYGQ